MAWNSLAASISYAVSYISMDRFLARRGLSAIVLAACQLAAAAVMLAVALPVSGAQAPHVTAENLRRATPDGQAVNSEDGRKQLKERAARVTRRRRPGFTQG